MRSLLVSAAYFPPQVGGISHLMSSIVTALGPERVSCYVGAPATAARRVDHNGVRVYRAAFRSSRMSRAMRLGPILLRENVRALQLATAEEGYIGLALKRWLGLPYIIWAHGNEIGMALSGERPDLVTRLHGASRVIAVSDYTARQVAATGVERSRIETIHPGCDSERFRPLAPDPDLAERLLGERRNTPVMLTVGGLVGRKGQDTVIRALPRITETVPDATYLIAGDGPDRERLENLATSLGVRDRVVFAGPVDDADLPSIYALADVFAMVSREQAGGCDVEGFGLVFLEAAACGKPSVGGRSGGVPDAVCDGHTGFLVDPLSVEDTADTLARLLTDRACAETLGANGREWVTRKRRWSDVGAAVHATVQEAAQTDTSLPMLPGTRANKRDIDTTRNTQQVQRDSKAWKHAPTRRR